MNKNPKIFVIFLFTIPIGAIAFYFVISSRTFQFYGGIINRVHTGRKVVALTFDDGPSAHTPEISGTLKSHNVHATFFLIGSELEKNMEYGKMLVQAGEEIGNHTYSHNRMVFKSPATIKDEIERTDSLVRAAGYIGTIYFRPPGCKKFIGLPRYLFRHNRQTITWDIEPETNKASKTAAGITADVMKNVQPGSVILLHVMTSSAGESRKSLDGIITGLQAQGYTLVTVSELLTYEGK